MALIVADRIQESSTSTGTGSIALTGAHTGYRTFASVMSVSDTAHVVVEGLDSNGNPNGEWECFLATYASLNTLSRGATEASSNGGAAVDFTAGNKRVFITASATYVAGKVTATLDTDTALAANSDTRVPSQKAVKAYVDASGGGGGSGWTVVGSWTYSTDVAGVDFTDLGAYNELIVIARATTASVSGVRRVVVSTNNGSSFYTSAADYKAVTTAGVEGNAAGNGIGYHSTNSTAARSFWTHIRNMKGPVKLGISIQGAPDGQILFVGSTDDINAIRVDNQAGGNITGGNVVVLGR